MIKVFEHFDLAIVGHIKSVLEADGIQTYLKNQYTSGVLGEIPFVEAVPELWVVEDGDVARANALIRGLQLTDEMAGPEWQCQNCGSTVDGVYGRCWNCEQARPQESPA
ncbi:MAG: DUF2007 domain-containing protein [Xanthomonadales bacterium]|nr:DUF2007 domain-containing protein [Xanthomonadales bacterium]NNL95302.1 DUF2007 domain-containing protein [Xanthomonadales bacterium]